VRAVDRHPGRRILIGALRAASEALGIVVIAEGVETIEERESLVAQGCDLFQGFLFARPQPAFCAPSWPRGE
jgi:EAL domain-containing protein (putative c-di-GMP-specific phosphodiesterase class I)